VKLTDGAPVPYAFVGLMTDAFQMSGYTSTDTSGEFSIAGDQDAGYLVVQPPALENDRQIGIYAAQPRIYNLAPGGNSTPLGKLDLRLPQAGCLVLLAYDASGTLMRWEDFRRNGTFGEQFVFATNMRDQTRPAVCWPVYDQAARDQGSPREKGFPALVVEPASGGATAEPWVVQVLFWPTAGYGKLHLRADNEGQGFRILEHGAAIHIELNAELARTAVADLGRRKNQFHDNAAESIAALKRALDAALAQDTPQARAASADTVLADALRLRDQLEIEAARRAIPRVRQGRLHIRIEDASGQPVEGCTVRVEQRTSDFQFGVFEGSPYDARAVSAFKRARAAGFNMATVLLGWNWTDISGGRTDAAAVDSLFGISALHALGYTVKAHGVVWLQEYGILPARAKTLSHNALRAAAVDQARVLVDTFRDRISVWEAMNEPAATNTVEMPRAMLNELLADSARIIKRHPGLTALVNSGHEIDYGRKYMFFGLDNRPASDFSLTYSKALERAQAQGALNHVDAVGIQFYPGYRFNETFGGLEGPAMTPSWLVDTLMRYYAAFAKPLHITECSIPSSYGRDWNAGYWREPWNETTQADYAEAVFTLAFGNPAVRSITWWDVSDAKPSVVTGGLIDASGRDKPALERIEMLIRQWRTACSVETDSDGTVELPAFAGGYEVEAQLPGGGVLRGEAYVYEREPASLVLSAKTNQGEAQP
jgi:hypothetical protein